MSACSTYSVVKQTSIKEIQFGYGGGVTQSITRYTLKPDGKLYRGQEIIKKVAKDDVLHIYEKAASLDCNEINSPSNTFSFINIIHAVVGAHQVAEFARTALANALVIFNVFDRIQNRVNAEVRGKPYQKNHADGLNHDYHAHNGQFSLQCFVNNYMHFICDF